MGLMSGSCWTCRSSSLSARRSAAPCAHAHPPATRPSAPRARDRTLRPAIRPGRRAARVDTADLRGRNEGEVQYAYARKSDCNASGGPSWSNSYSNAVGRGPHRAEGAAPNAARGPPSIDGVCCPRHTPQGRYMRSQRVATARIPSSKFSTLIHSSGACAFSPGNPKPISSIGAPRACAKSSTTGIEPPSPTITGAR